MILIITLAIIAVIGLSYFLIIKKKKTKPISTTISTSNFISVDNAGHPSNSNIAFGYAALTRSNEVEPTSAPIHKTAEVENNLGAETAVITPETKVPKKRAPRKKKEEKV